MIFLRDSTFLFFSFCLLYINGTQTLVDSKINTITRFTKDLGNLNPFSSSHPFRNLLNHSGSSSSNSKPSYKPKPSYRAPKPSYKSPGSGSKKPSYKLNNSANQKPSYGSSSSLRAPTSTGVQGYNGGQGTTGAGSTLTREELLTLVLQMHSMIHELIEENNESYGTPLGKPINGGSTQSLPTYGTASQALESYGVSNSQPLNSFNSQNSLPTYGGSNLPAQAPNLYVGPTAIPSSASVGYSGASSATSGYSGPSSASSGYSGPSSASLGYSGPSSASSGYSGPSSASVGFSGPSSSSSGYSGPSGSSDIQATFSGSVQPSYNSASTSSSSVSSASEASDSYGDPIADPVISSTLDQIVNTLSAYQSNQPNLQSSQRNQASYTSNTRTRRKNEFVPSPKWYPDETESEDSVVTNPQRIRAILAILENRRIDESSPSNVSKRNIEDILELLDIDLEQDAEYLVEDLAVNQEHELILESFFKRK